MRVPIVRQRYIFSHGSRCDKCCYFVSQGLTIFCLDMRPLPGCADLTLYDRSDFVGSLAYQLADYQYSPYHSGSSRVTDQIEINIDSKSAGKSDASEAGNECDFILIRCSPGPWLIRTGSVPHIRSILNQPSSSASLRYVGFLCAWKLSKMATGPSVSLLSSIYVVLFPLIKCNRNGQCHGV